MNKRKILTLGLSLCMIAILAVGGTLAYFTDVDADRNVLTVGNIDIEQVENFDSETPLTPGGEHITKEVTVTNEGQGDAYFRTFFAFEDTRDLNTAVTYCKVPSANCDTTIYFPNNGVDNWLQIQDADGTVYTVGYITYNTILEPGQTSDLLLQHVYIGEEANNVWAEIAGESWDLLVMTQACQTDPFTSATEALNTTWGEVTVDSDEQVAAWFTEAGLGNFTAFDYTYYADNGIEMWYEVQE